MVEKVAGSSNADFPLDHSKHVELIALDAAPAPAPERKLTVDELLASRIKLPPGVSPLSLEDMERAIAEGALGR